MISVQNGVRRSARIPINKPVQVSGVNVEGRDFAADASTLLLSQHGAMIVVKQGLVPDQEVGLFNPETAREEDARVVAMLRDERGSYTYGVEFLDPEVDFWNITFPAVDSFATSSAESRMTHQPEPIAKTPISETKVHPMKALTAFEPGVLKPLLIAEIRPSNLVSVRKLEIRDYSILLKCPYDNQDQWIILRGRSEPLTEILATRWSFDCAVHGALLEYPVIANEGAVKQAASAKDSNLGFAEMEGFYAKGRVGNASRVQTRFPEARRVWVRGVDALGNPFMQSTLSINISRNGARLQGLGFLAGTGIELELKRNWKKALYQVVWIGHSGSGLAQQVGMVCLQPEKNVWGLT
ncbi:MAG: PilZ domain-containing protein [Acidobacteria bacterium]|nr:PilZ domain-containing protein [Acidobacteriota bacterium]